MKTLRITVCLLFALLFVLPAIAQDAARPTNQSGDKWSEFYYLNLPIEKVYPHRLGYVVVYRKSGNELGRTYLPMEWFADSAGKGELIKIHSGAVWPYLSVFYKSGKFDHLRLYVRSSFDHPSWGNLPQGASIDDNFKVEDLKLEF